MRSSRRMGNNSSTKCLEDITSCSEFLHKLYKVAINLLQFVVHEQDKHIFFMHNNIFKYKL